MSAIVGCKVIDDELQLVHSVAIHYFFYVGEDCIFNCFPVHFEDVSQRIAFVHLPFAGVTTVGVVLGLVDEERFNFHHLIAAGIEFFEEGHCPAVQIRSLRV